MHGCLRITLIASSCANCKFTSLPTNTISKSFKPVSWADSKTYIRSISAGRRANAVVCRPTSPSIIDEYPDVENILELTGERSHLKGKIFKSCAPLMATNIHDQRLEPYRWKRNWSALVGRQLQFPQGSLLTRFTYKTRTDCCFHRQRSVLYSFEQIKYIRICLYAFQCLVMVPMCMRFCFNHPTSEI